MTSVQMRPGPSQLFDYLSNNGSDLLGMGWTKEAHIEAWKQHARGMAAFPAFAKRVWAFDFTVLPPKSSNASYLYLNTADQTQVFEALVAAHPRGPDAVLAKTESLHVVIDPRHGGTTCAFHPNVYNHSGSFIDQLVHQTSDVPYQFIAERGGRHGWEGFAALAMPSLPHNQSDVPSMYPVPQLVNNSLYLDLDDPAPHRPQRTLWSEIWRMEVIEEEEEEEE